MNALLFLEGKKRQATTHWDRAGSASGNVLTIIITDRSPFLFGLLRIHGGCVGLVPHSFLLPFSVLMQFFRVYTVTTVQCKKKQTPFSSPSSSSSFLQRFYFGCGWNMKEGKEGKKRSSDTIRTTGWKQSGYDSYIYDARRGGAEYKKALYSRIYVTNIVICCCKKLWHFQYTKFNEIRLVRRDIKKRKKNSLTRVDRGGLVALELALSTRIFYALRSTKCSNKKTGRR